MGDTSRFALSYPEQGDEVNGPVQIQDLAQDVDGHLSRLFECTSTTRPTGIPAGFMISETDTGGTYKYLAGSWVAIGGAAGGGTTASYRASATADQSIPATSSGPGTVVGFPTEDDADALVTRTAEGSGHKFELNASGIWILHAAVRIRSTSAAGEVSLDMRAGDRSLDLDGGRREGLPRSLHCAAGEYLAAGTVILTRLFNGTGGTRLTEASAGNWVHFSAALVGG